MVDLDRASRPIADSGSAQERVLFVCTHNSARNQMAEALLRHVAGEQFQVARAGTAPPLVHPLAERVMAERGLSLRSHRAEALDEMGAFPGAGDGVREVVVAAAPVLDAVPVRRARHRALQRHQLVHL